MINKNVFFIIVLSKNRKQAGIFSVICLAAIILLQQIARVHAFSRPSVHAFHAAASLKHPKSRQLVCLLSPQGK